MKYADLQKEITYGDIVKYNTNPYTSSSEYQGKLFTFIKFAYCGNKGNSVGHCRRCNGRILLESHEDSKRIDVCWNYNGDCPLDFDRDDFILEHDDDFIQASEMEL